ncbi:MAG: hypothetical protein ACPGSB_02610 [Opitutales bacterium]
MDDFETFKASREKIDPSSRKFSENQWQKAYVAYRNSRERVGDSRQSKSGEGSKHRRGSSKGKKKVSSALHPTLALRNEVRQSSAYSDLRMIVDLLAWIGVGVVVLNVAIKLVYHTDAADALASVVDAAFQVIALILLRLLAHVLVDIPDIALYECAVKVASKEEGPQSRD